MSRARRVCLARVCTTDTPSVHVTHVARGDDTRVPRVHPPLPLAPTPSHPLPPRDSRPGRGDRVGRVGRQGGSVKTTPKGCQKHPQKGVKNDPFGGSFRPPKKGHFFTVFTLLKAKSRGYPRLPHVPFLIRYTTILGESETQNRGARGVTLQLNGGGVQGEIGVY